MFFEQQLEELMEEHGLGEDSFFYDCNQLPGDVIYIPDGLVMTSLSLVDSISYRQHASDSQRIPEEVNANIWHPESGQVPTGFQFALCTGVDLDVAGRQLGKQVHPQMGAQVTQIMKQFFPDVRSHNRLILSMLAECSGVTNAKISGTYCPSIWSPCVAQLKKN